ncbi:hypothetical protein LTR53_004102 [Teratosphaeriaceae sp. CCFEE 6253]|nr:hypothetical protein LTR53_004102 [Teratosphaeriaceae sp. CCFEE 6253]
MAQGMEKRVREAFRRDKAQYTDAKRTLSRAQSAAASDDTPQEQKDQQEAVGRAASIDMAALEARTTELREFLDTRDYAHPRLQKLLEPYTSVAVNDGADDSDDPGDSLFVGLYEDGLVEEASGLRAEGEASTTRQSAGTSSTSKDAAGGNALNTAQSTSTRTYVQLPWCPTIVLDDDGSWVELRCKVCGGNTHPNGGGLLHGAEAMLRHLVKGHGCVPMPLGQVVRMCRMRRLGRSSVGAIWNGGATGMPYVDSVTINIETPEAIKARRGERPAGKMSTDEYYACVAFGWGKHPDNVVEAVPCVVKHPNGKWVELACPVCHGNGVHDGRRNWLQGPKGFYDHLYKSHGRVSKGLSLADIIEQCQVRELTEQELGYIRKGRLNRAGIEQVLVGVGDTASFQRQLDRTSTVGARLRALAPPKATKRKADVDVAKILGRDNAAGPAPPDTSAPHLPHAMPRPKSRRSPSDFNYKDHLPGAVAKKRRVAAPPQDHAGLALLEISRGDGDVPGAAEKPAHRAVRRGPWIEESASDSDG